MSKLDDILAALKAKRSGKEWMARCPAHNDRTPSLSIGVSSDGKTLVHCFKGCATADVLARIGFTPADLFEQAPPAAPRQPKAARTFATVEAAVRSLQSLGRHVRTFSYSAADGSEFFHVTRFEREDGSKTFRPISRSGARWIVADPPDPLPLYGLPALHGAELVLALEGEGCAEIARELGFVATTSAHGAKSARRTDWSPLAGKRVAILPDADDTGRAYAETVAEILLTLDPQARVCIVNLPGLDRGEDIADLVKTRRAAGVGADALRAEILALVERAQPYVSERDADSDASAFEPLPLDAFPDALRAFIKYGSKSTCSDPSFVAVPMLSVLAGSIGNAAEIELRPGWCEPSILWTAIVSRSGTRKSPALRLVKDPLKRLQARAQKQYEQALVEYRRAKAESEAQRKSRGGAPLSVADEPRAPILRRHFVSDITMEALGTILVEQKRGTTVVRDELSGWVRSFDQYKARGGDDEARWLELWSADTLSIERRSGEQRSFFVERPAVSITGSIQPGILADVFTRSRRESGLLARLSFAYPPPVRARWRKDPGDAQSTTDYARAVERLASLPVDADAEGSPQPARLRLSAKAEPPWAQFYEETEARALELGDDGGATWAKLPGICARIALVLELATWAGQETPGDLPREITLKSMASAIRLALWFGREALRVHALLDRSSKDRELDSFEERIAQRNGSVSVRNWQRARTKRTADDARAELQRLVDAGRARWDTSKGSASLVLLLTSRRRPEAQGPPPQAPAEGVSEVSVSDPSEPDTYAAAERAAVREADAILPTAKPDDTSERNGAPKSGVAQVGRLFVDMERNRWEDH